MTWTLMAFLSAVFGAGRAIYDKDLLDKRKLCTYAYGFWVFIVPAILMSAAALYYQEWTHLTNVGFLIPTFGNVTFNIIALFLYAWIIRREEASVVYAVKSLEPIVIGLLAFILLGEVLSPMAMAGLGVIVMGCYALERSRHSGKEKTAVSWRIWAVIMAMVTLTAFATVCSKEALTQGAVSIYIATRYTLMCGAFFIMTRTLPSADSAPKLDRSLVIRIIISGLFLTLSVVCEMYALTLTNAAYVDAVRKLSLVIIILFEGMVMYNRMNFSRLFAGSIMIFGVLMVSFHDLV